MIVAALGAELATMNSSVVIFRQTVMCMRPRRFSRTRSVMELFGETIVMYSESPLCHTMVAAQIPTPPTSPTGDTKIPRIASDPALSAFLEEMYAGTPVLNDEVESRGYTSLMEVMGATLNDSDAD